ncbi:fatty acid-binding protein, muscle-like [Homalodisca vitripennis]|uniref:fatty acid-binding protein, muscle-like n=1 Tax=Homalodisca vitripennis TaxID=197043 RepID=UPI001EEB0706|nr:fatty acid-binding protein, muscle-like [Homalodisca vitripennis]KAG8335541.1 regulation of retrograde trans-synaptic signaling by endocanabinoid [Homalodisca vitripennis]
MISIKFWLVVVGLVAIFYTNSISGQPLKDDAGLKPFLNKKYELTSSDENFDEIMKILGVGYVTRNLGKLAKPVMELSEDNGVYTLTSESTFRNTITKFKIGEEFDDETPDGRKVRSTFTQEKNKLIQVQRGDKVTTIVREFADNEVKVTVKVGDIASVRIYSAL